MGRRRDASSVLLACFFIPFLMGDCYRERQAPVYGTPEQARAVNYVMQQGVLQPPVAQAPTPVPMGGTVTYQECIAVVATDESNPDGKPPVGYPVPSAAPGYYRLAPG